MKHLLLGLSFYFATQAAFADAGFFSGNTMVSYTVVGNVSLTCMRPDGPPKTVVFQCRDSILRPKEFDYFVGPSGMRGNLVSLDVIRADGSLRSKDAPYDDKRGISLVRLNLWSNVILSKPLLAVGENRVQYKIRNNGSLSGQGEFKATVQVGGLSTCSPGQFYSNSEQECSEPYTYCQKYFEEKNFCQPDILETSDQ